MARWWNGDVRYEGIVVVSGSTQARATIEDVDLDAWRGTIGEIQGLSPLSGLHSIRIRDGERAGLFAIAELDYDDEQRMGSLIGRTPFGPDPYGSSS